MRIQETRPKPTRLIDIAREVGISRYSVAKVLLGSGSGNVVVSEATAKRIRSAAQAMNYRPNQAARMLKGVGSRIIGVLVDSDTSPDKLALISQLEAAASERNYQLMVAQTHDNFEGFRKQVDAFLEHGLVGAVCISHDYPGIDSQIATYAAQLPNLVFIGKPAVKNACYLDVDHEQASREVVQHLLARGRRRIGLAFVDLRYQVNIERRRGAREAIRTSGQAGTVLKVWTFSEPPARGAHDLKPDQAAEILDLLVGRQKVDAIIAHDDAWAAQLAKQLIKRGRRVPEDVAIVGYGNTHYGTLTTPELTTVDEKTDEMAIGAIKLLLARKAKRLNPEQRVVAVTPALVVRESG